MSEYIYCQVLQGECDKPREERDPGYGMCRNCPAAIAYTKDLAQTQVKEQKKGGYFRARANRYFSEGFVIEGGPVKSITVFRGTITRTMRQPE